MASFAYVARETGSGREIRSSVDATTEQAAIAALLNRNLLVVSIQERVGEKGGLLAEILARLAVYLENAARLRKKVKAAMMYPTVVTVVAILITIFLLIRVVPVFGEIFQSFQAELPAPTKFLINLSNGVKK